jgi:hypothetical protein
MRKIFETRWALLIIVAFGLGARMAAATLGQNFDMNSWFVVADIMSHGGNVYAETKRYNYGPVWFFILQGLDVLALHRHQILRYLIAVFLSGVDVGIFLFLCRRVGRLAGVLFFLNPVSILITGYHSQFDNLAILMGLWSVWLFGDDFEKPVNRRKFFGLLVLGLSLMTKHLFFAFPLWLAVKQKGAKEKILILVVPVACFLLGFAPYWGAGRQGIIEHVFHYDSCQGNYFFSFFVPQCIQWCCSSRTWFFGLLVVFAFICRARNGFESLLIYTGVLVACAPVSTNEYLAIPIALTAVFPSALFALYSAISLLHLSADVNGPHFLKAGLYIDLAIYVLACALAWLFWRPLFLEWLRKVRQQLAIQFEQFKQG